MPNPLSNLFPTLSQRRRKSSIKSAERNISRKSSKASRSGKSNNADDAGAASQIHTYPTSLLSRSRTSVRSLPAPDSASAGAVAEVEHQDDVPPHPESASELAASGSSQPEAVLMEEFKKIMQENETLKAQVSSFSSQLSVIEERAQQMASQLQKVDRLLATAPDRNLSQGELMEIQGLRDELSRAQENWEGRHMALTEEQNRLAGRLEEIEQNLDSRLTEEWDRKAKEIMSVVEGRIEPVKTDVADLRTNVDWLVRFLLFYAVVGFVALYPSLIGGRKPDDKMIVFESYPSCQTKLRM